MAADKMSSMIVAQRRAANASGAAFRSSYDAMGGGEAMNVWTAQGLSQADHVHLTRAGYNRLADYFYQDLTLAFGNAVFFFQAEDGIRDVAVTGVQTCALPI